MAVHKLSNSILMLTLEIIFLDEFTSADKSVFFYVNWIKYGRRAR